MDDSHIIQTLQYEIHHIVTSISNNNYHVAFNSTHCYFLTYLLDWYLLNISRTWPLHHYVTLAVCIPIYSFLAICSTLVSLWLISLWFTLVWSPLFRWSCTVSQMTHLPAFRSCISGEFELLFFFISGSDVISLVSLVLMSEGRAMPHIKRSLPSNSHNWTSTDSYRGLATNFKERCRNHTSSFRHQNNWHETELSKHIWTLKDNNKSFDLKWKIIKQCKPYNSITKKCNLCLFEKFIIIFKKDLCSLNKRNELSSCPHRNKYLLKTFMIKY